MGYNNYLVVKLKAIPDGGQLGAGQLPVLLCVRVLNALADDGCKSVTAFPLARFDNATTCRKNLKSLVRISLSPSANFKTFIQRILCLST